MYYVIQCRFSDFLIQLRIENAFFFRSVQKYYYHVQKNCLFLGPCRNITIQGQGVPGVPCRAIFRGREEILIFGEIFTSKFKVTVILHPFPWQALYKAAITMAPLLSNPRTEVRIHPSIHPLPWSPGRLRGTNEHSPERLLIHHHFLNIHRYCTFQPELGHDCN